MLAPEVRLRAATGKLLIDGAMPVVAKALIEDLVEELQIESSVTALVTCFEKWTDCCLVRTVHEGVDRSRSDARPRGGRGFYRPRDLS